MLAKWWNSNPLALDAWGFGHRLACLAAFLAIALALVFACWRIEPLVLCLLSGFCVLALAAGAGEFQCGIRQGVCAGCRTDPGCIAAGQPQA